MTARTRERHSLHLPESDNDVWRLIRESGVRITLYIEVPGGFLEEILERIRTSHSILALQALRHGIMRAGGRRVMLTSRAGRERYLVYLPEALNDLWRILHENDVRVNAYIVIPYEEREKLGE